tara:strand:- start:133 stop:708 length:576 start_codon:yes stop_codon:yes gene_type:complete
MGLVDFSVDTFKQNFDGGTRPNRFVITGEIGGSGGTTKVNNLYVKAGSMPASTMGVIQVPFRGRVIKLPGDRAYPEWTFTMLDEHTEDFRTKFEEWNEAFNSHAENISGTDAGGIDLTSTDLFTQWHVAQLDMQGNVIRSTTLNNCWPIEVGAVDLTYDSADTLTEYSITLAYDYINLNSSTSPSGLGGSV